MDLKEYQEKAKKTEHEPDHRKGLTIAVLGLVSEAGSVANVVKKFLRDAIEWNEQRAFLIEEIGDVLWYLADVASRMNIDLSVVAEMNLERTRDRFEEKGVAPPPPIVLDAAYKVEERFPRLIVFHFSEERRDDDRAIAKMTVVYAEPNPFKHGALIDPITGKTSGFSLGDPLNDNSLREDGYRFHDAFHIGLMAVLGWSPVMRHLLNLKRKSNTAVDENEDGRRARDVEEGLSTYLFMRSRRFNKFQRPENVGNDTLDDVRDHTANLEVHRLPTKLWKKAISEGFRALETLTSNHGGYLIADLDARTVTFQKFWSNPTSDTAE